MGRLSRWAGATVALLAMSGEAESQFQCQIRTPAEWVRRSYIPYGYTGPMVLMHRGHPLDGNYFRGYFRTGRLSLDFFRYEAVLPVSRYSDGPDCYLPNHQRNSYYPQASSAATEESGERILYHELDRAGVPFTWKKYIEGCQKSFQVDAQAGCAIIDVVKTSGEAVRRARELGRNYTPIVAGDFDSKEELEGAVKQKVQELVRDP